VPTTTTPRIHEERHDAQQHDEAQEQHRQHEQHDAQEQQHPPAARGSHDHEKHDHEKHDHEKHDHEAHDHQGHDHAVRTADVARPQATQDAPPSAAPHVPAGAGVLPIEEFAIPALDLLHDLLPAPALAMNALRDALDHRTGVLLLGPKWSGKTAGLQRAMAELDDEARALAAQLAGYQRRRFLYLHGVRPKHGRDLFQVILRQLAPAQADRLARTRRSEDAWRADVLAMLRTRGITLLVLDEAEYLEDAALDALRSLMADAEAAEAQRVVQIGGQDAYRAAGLGVVLSGAPGLLTAMTRSPDHGLRWSKRYTVPLVPAAAVWRVYAAIFPRLGAQLTPATTTKFATWIEHHIALGRAMPLGVITMHARRYFTAMVEATCDDGAPIRTREATPFNQATFLAVARDLEWFATRGTPTAGA
jgi:hypothetical protein